MAFGRPGGPTDFKNFFAGRAGANESTIGSASYAYSPRNLLASGDGISYCYDGLRRRVTATMPAFGTRISLCDANLKLTPESAMKSAVIATITFRFGSTPVAQENIGAQTAWTATDHLGAPIIQTNAFGAIAWQADYEPYGAVYKLHTPDMLEPIRFPGQEAEELDAFQRPNGASSRFSKTARWYRPQWGMYTRRDPYQIERERSFRPPHLDFRIILRILDLREITS